LVLLLMLLRVACLPSTTTAAQLSAPRWRLLSCWAVI
jgi:hypothetical protein